jgi:hypothetical protein
VQTTEPKADLGYTGRKGWCTSHGAAHGRDEKGDLEIQMAEICGMKRPDAPDISLSKE